MHNAKAAKHTHTRTQQARRSGSRLQVPQLNLHFRWLIFRSYSHITSACRGRASGRQYRHVHKKKKKQEEAGKHTSKNNAVSSRRVALRLRLRLCVTHAGWTWILRLKLWLRGAWRGAVESDTTYIYT